MAAVAAKAAGEFKITLDGVEYPVVVETAQGSSWTIVVNGRSFKVELEGDDTVLVDGITYDVTVDGEMVRADDASYTMEVSGLSVGRAAPGAKLTSGAVAEPAAAKLTSRSVEAAEYAGAITAIMPGQVTRIMVEEGQKVREGEAVCVLEAMKMENELRTDREGVVKAVHVRPGENVEKDQVLVEVE